MNEKLEYPQNLTEEDKKGLFFPEESIDYYADEMKRMLLDKKKSTFILLEKYKDRLSVDEFVEILVSGMDLAGLMSVSPLQLLYVDYEVDGSGEDETVDNTDKEETPEEK